jgi:hypothetical protein
MMIEVDEKEARLLTSLLAAEEQRPDLSTRMVESTRQLREKIEQAETPPFCRLSEEDQRSIVEQLSCLDSDELVNFFKEGLTQSDIDNLLSDDPEAAI